MKSPLQRCITRKLLNTRFGSHHFSDTMNTSSAQNFTSSSPASSFSLQPISISINLILGLPLNSYVIWLILRGPKETMASDIFSLNLATSELLFASSGVWFWLYARFQSSLCQMVFMFSLGLVYTARPLFQSCICVEYYLGVIHPVVFLRFKPLRYRVVCSCVLWLIILLSCIYNVYTYSALRYITLYFIQTLLMFGVILFCCLSVLWALKRPGPGDGDTGKRTSNAMKRKAFKIIVIIMIVLTIYLFLYMAAILLICLFELKRFILIYLNLTSIALLTGLLHPLMYLHRSKKLSCFSKVK